MTGIPLAVLQTHCDEMPLQIRRLKYEIRYGVQVKSTVDHVSSKVSKIIGPNTKAKVSDFFAQHEANIPTSDNESIPPWFQTPLLTNDILSNNPKRQGTTFVCRTL